LLILTLVIPAEARELTPEDRIRKLKLGSSFVVTLKDKQTLKGRLGQVAQGRFTLEPLVPGSPGGRVVLFQDVRKVGSAKALAIKDVLLVPVGVVMVIPYLVYCTAAQRNCFY
jgi:hypothetical protein